MSRSHVDDAELRIRLIPGVVAVGVEQPEDGHYTLTVVLDSASDTASVEEELRLLMNPLPDVELRIRPITSFVSGAAMLDRMLHQAGAVACTIDGDPVSGIRSVRATVESLADVSRITDVVGGVLGEEFVNERLEVELRIPLTREGPSRRDASRTSPGPAREDPSGELDHQASVDSGQRGPSNADL